MKKMLLFLSSLCCSSAFMRAQMPIVGYMGVPKEETSVERYVEMRNCGFNTSISLYRHLDEVYKALDAAEKAKMKLIPYCTEVEKDLKANLPRLKEHLAFMSYLLGDEPTMEKIPAYSERLKKIREVDTSFPCYINLAPYYDSETLQWLGVTKYEDYLKAASNRFSLPQISFDYYPIVKSWTGKVRIRPTWYACLEAVRAESLRTGVPFWGFVLSTPHAVYPKPTLASLRLQIYSNLLYGAQGIQYFTYWTPAKEDKYDYYDGPIALKGKRTATYNVVREMNTELQSVSSLFCEGKILSVGHIGNVPKGARRFESMPSSLAEMKVEAKDGVLCAILLSGKEYYLLIQNKSLHNPVWIYNRGNARSLYRITKDLRKEKMEKEYTLDCGDLLIIQYR